VAMTFRRLVRFEQGVEAKFAGLLSETEDGFIVKPWEGSLDAGLQVSDAPSVRLTKANLHYPHPYACEQAM
jgi:hypothetical protein